MGASRGNNWVPYQAGRQYPGSTPSIPPRGITSLLSRIGEVRDGLLVSASILYVIGYLVWSYHAWRNGLGLLPALDAQYFVAGLAPSIVMLAGYRVAGYLKRFFIYWKELVGVHATGAARIVRSVLQRAFSGALLLMAFGPVVGLAILLATCALLLLTHWRAPAVHGAIRRFRFEKAYDSTREVARNISRGTRPRKMLANDAVTVMLFLLGMLGFVYLQTHRDEITLRVFSRNAESINATISLVLFVTLTLLPPSDDKYLRVMSEAYRAFWVYVAVPLVIVGALAFYLTRIYPNLPQEFGGLKPRCAYLDVVRSKLSTETLTDILSDEQMTGNQPVVRSARVEVLFSGSSAVYVRSRRGVHEIAKDAIAAVNACD